MTPLIRIAGGALTGHMADDARLGRPQARTGGNESAASLADRVLSAADALLSGTATDPESWIESGADAARQLMAMSPHHLDPGGRLAGSILEILGVQGGAPGDRPASPPPAATLADRLGTLLLLAAVLRQMPAGLGPGVEPLWVIEDPEAHLHPMTLAATERLLARIRWQKIVTTQSGELPLRLKSGDVQGRVVLKM